jgi:dTDP-4-amino-4,6-dideoxygalactose transaminase
MLHPRHRIDIGVEDLAFGLAECARGRDASTAAAALAATVGDELLATRSVRSGFDLLLGALDLSPGDEVMLSALTIPDMARIVRGHGLVPIPVDVDPRTLSPTEDSLERARSSRSKLLVVAQLLGARADMSAARAFSARHAIPLVDDDAQGYLGPSSLAARDAAVVFHSFGSIKTATCLGGALVRVRDPALRARMRRAQALWPAHPSGAYAKKLAQYAALMFPREPRVYRAFGAACDRYGQGLDAVVMSMTRGFPAADTEALFAALRRQPCGPMLSLLARRIERYDPTRAQRRAAAGERMLDRMKPSVSALGDQMHERTHWLFAPMLDRPDDAIALLRAEGFDAARGTTSITALDAPHDRPELAPKQAIQAMKRVLFVPIYPEISQSDRDRLAAALSRIAERRAAVGPRPHDRGETP